MQRLLLLIALSTLTVHDRAKDLLSQLMRGHSPVIAEAQLEKEGAEQANVRAYLSENLPSALSQQGDVERIWLLARLAGVLRLDTTVVPLSNLLQKQTKYLATTFYQAAHLTDDPVALALVQIGPPAVAPVSKILTANDPDARIRAIRILGNLRTAEALSALQKQQMREVDPQVRSILNDVLAVSQ